MKTFRMPKMNITGRTSSVTNAFVNGIIPCVYPTKSELLKSLEILNLSKDDLRCVYCDDKATEWDHLRPIVAKKKPTGYISDIYNLVPSCGKCNQSKGNKNWKEWITGKAPLSPAQRKVPKLDSKIKRLETYEKWKSISPINFEKYVEKKLWLQHWDNCKKLHDMMEKAQKLAETIKANIESKMGK